MILHNFYCVGCDFSFEELVRGEEEIVCLCCHKVAERVLFDYAPTSEYSPRRAEIHMKARAMRAKMAGRVPWRKNSYSQTGNE